MEQRRPAGRDPAGHLALRGGGAADGQRAVPQWVNLRVDGPGHPAHSHSKGQQVGHHEKTETYPNGLEHDWYTHLDDDEDEELISELVGEADVKKLASLAKTHDDDDGFDASSRDERTNTADVDWDAVSRVAEGLSTADVVAAGEDAGRRAVLSSSDRILTDTLVASMERRRSLHGLGTSLNGTKSPSSDPKRPRTSSRV